MHLSPFSCFLILLICSLFSVSASYKRTFFTSLCLETLFSHSHPFCSTNRRNCFRIVGRVILDTVEFSCAPNIWITLPKKTLWYLTRLMIVESDKDWGKKTVDKTWLKNNFPRIENVNICVSEREDDE
ncbi:hypothetical protein IFM89_015838 [Coptis chinensis]|uniref:Secreted protein n=1 Tax=Coptis chinensis TaxID=261450 RepID=A0A835IN60_9MAGN|nr:hypothetical protein IFM89_015838 [Coptis chinensis]